MSIPTCRKLSALEELSLIRKVQFQSPDSRSASDALVRSYRPLIANVARRYFGKGEWADLVSEATLGFLEAIRKFDPLNGVRLGTYAVYWIRKRVQDYVNAEREQSRCLSNFEELPSHHAYDAGESRWIDVLTDRRFEDDRFDIFTQTAVRRAMANLSPRQKAVLGLLFWEDRSKSDIACCLRISPPRVTKLLKLSFGKLTEDLRGVREVLAVH